MASSQSGQVSQHGGEKMSTGEMGVEPMTPVLVILEEPKERGMRFRYKCEGSKGGNILGATSTEKHKSVPTIEIQGSLERVRNIKVTVSLVTKDSPHRQHPHSLVGKGCSEGVCVIYLKPSSPRHSFSSLGIQCVKRKEMDAALERRRSLKIDPFNTSHTKSIEDMDMNVVRLCFQCEVERRSGEWVPLEPVVSKPMYDNKATITSELKIYRLNVERGPCTGKNEIYMLCDKVAKDDIEILFTKGTWKAKAEFAQTDVHRQIAVVFKTPPYQELDISQEVEVDVILRRLSDQMDSEPVPFTYLPHNPDPYEINRKRKIKSDRNADTCSVSAGNQMLQEPPISQLFSQHTCTLPECTGPGAEFSTLTTQAQEEVGCTDPFHLSQLSSEDQNMISSFINQILTERCFPKSPSFGQQQHLSPVSDNTVPGPRRSSFALLVEPACFPSVENIDLNFDHNIAAESELGQFIDDNGCMTFSQLPFNQNEVLSALLELLPQDQAGSPSQQELLPASVELLPQNQAGSSSQSHRDLT
ncbi:hypothetical protein AAFF_G00280750 [Aldrovandia affinis]|uniref:RHD domain-containing protein n=1 Tax=Aldrovandia affinis TaxID=143900 RepID=A0AAD7RAB4_9TELE|nr:hypothetical protein AAFF_G00280750 [Aldrovandia affinis]